MEGLAKGVFCFIGCVRASGDGKGGQFSSIVFEILGYLAFFDETWLLRLGKNSYIALGLMRNGLVSRTTGSCFTHNG